MITKVTKENRGLYSALFTKATAQLYGPSPTDEQIISSLDDYFANFQGLTQASPTYAILPLDEPFFEIDANTRVIKVPSEFKNNGISVKGDQIAEIVYFTIDRYYDTIDLFDDSVHIFIQWESPNGEDRRVYPAIFKDISILRQKGKMLFGWTIDNIITAHTGSMKFSVRFISGDIDGEGNPRTTFSLSTLTASAIVNPGLDFGFTGLNSAEDVIDNEQLVINRFIDSENYDDTYHAEIPEFLRDIPTPNTSFATITEDGVVYYCVDLVDGLYKLIAQATSDDAGVITYEWHRADIAAGINGDNISGNIEYIRTTDTTFQNSHPYYTHSVVDNADVYTPYTGYTVGEEIPTGEGAVALYEKVSTITVSRIGNYWVDAKNRSGKASASKTSQRVRVPGPADLSVTVAGDLSLDSEERYQAILNEQGEFTLQVTGTTARYGNDQGVGDEIVYTWYNNEDLDNALDDPITEVNGHSNSLTDTIDSSDRKNYDETFLVKIKATRNGASTDDIIRKFRVTDAAQVPTITQPTSADIDPESGFATVAALASVDAVHDAYEYKWYLASRGEDTEAEHADPGYNDELIMESEHAIGVNTATIQVDNLYKGKRIYCVATNVVNGTRAESRRPDMTSAEDRNNKTTIITED